MDRIRETMKWQIFALRLRWEIRRARAFDVNYGVETTKEEWLTDCGVPPDAAERGNRLYRVTWDGLVKDSLARLDIDRHWRYTFLDLGSGKGRILLQASLYPFKRIVGVEFAEPLHHIAVENCRRFRHPGQQCFDLEPIHGDVLDYELPSGPLVCFMCNPFDSETLARMLGRLRKRAENGDREIRVIYANIRTVNEAKTVLHAADWLRPVVQSSKFVILAPAPLRIPLRRHAPVLRPAFA